MCDKRPMRSQRPQSESTVRELFGLAGVTINGSAPGDIQVHDARFYERLLRDASIGVNPAVPDHGPPGRISQTGHSRGLCQTQ